MAVCGSFFFFVVVQSSCAGTYASDCLYNLDIQASLAKYNYVHTWLVALPKTLCTVPIAEYL